MSENLNKNISPDSRDTAIFWCEMSWKWAAISHEGTWIMCPTYNYSFSNASWPLNPSHWFSIYTSIPKESFHQVYYFQTWKSIYLFSKIQIRVDTRIMGIRLPAMNYVKEVLRRSLTRSQFNPASDVPKGHLAVYVGDSQTRFVIPISFLKHPSFQDLLRRAEDEFGFDHPMGGLTIPCHEDTFITVTSQLNYLWGSENNWRTNKNRSLSLVSHNFFSLIYCLEFEEKQWLLSQ